MYLLDGNYNTFSHSAYQIHNGFIVTLNLIHVTRITRIKVVNRGDCCRDRIIGFSVYIKKYKIEGEVSCGRMDEVKHMYEFKCEGTGYKVELRKVEPINEVNIAEVEIYGKRGLSLLNHLKSLLLRYYFCFSHMLYLRGRIHDRQTGAG